MKVLSAILILTTALSSLVAKVDFHKDVAPILREYCAGCHNEVDFEGEFSLETYKSLVKGGENGRGILPGKANESLLLQVLTKKKKPYMPPRKKPQPSAKQIEILRNWINEGAEGPATDVSILSTLIVPKVARAKGSARPITAIKVSPDGLPAIGRYGEIELGKRQLKGNLGKMNALAFSNDGKLLAAASGVTGLRGTAVLWNPEDGKRLREFGKSHRDILSDVAISPNANLLATASYDRMIKLWNRKDGKLVRTLSGHNGAVHDIAFSPDGTVLASAGGDSSIKLWQVSTGQRLDTFGQPTGEQFNVAFTPDGRHIVAAGADKQIRLWKWVSKVNPEINPLVQVRFAHEDEITRLAISRDGKTLVSASADKTVKTWSLPSVDSMQVFANQSDVVAALALSPDGRTLHVGRMDGSREIFSIKQRNAHKKIVQEEETKPTPRPNGAIATIEKISEREPNDTPKAAELIKVPAIISGVIHDLDGEGPEVDLFRFAARKGEQWVIETNASRSKSPLDSKVEILDTSGNLIERTRLQAVRETWLTFRGRNSTSSNDFRLFKWDEMSLNQLLYVNGEVVKLWHYPRGPDSGYIVYPGTGSRQGYFDTTPLAHPLGQPAYIVEPIVIGMEQKPNGLPTFPIYYENDDESKQRFGKDSKLTFTATKDDEYIVRVSDVRGMQGKDFKYSLTIRRRNPNFRVSLGGFGDGVPKGSGREFHVFAKRLDDYQGPIRVDVTQVPSGFKVTTPLLIEAGQIRAYGAVYADKNATSKKENWAKVTASATIGGKEVSHQVNNLGGLKPLEKPKISVRVLPSNGDSPQNISLEKPLQLTISPGETISAKVQVERNGFKGQVALGNHDSGRNLPHGVYVDNIGLNGLLIVEGQNEREFFITCDKWVPETTRLFHIKASLEKGLTTPPILLHVRKKLASK